MGQSLRIRSKLGINQTLNVPLDQEYEFLEILSLKILQADIYTRSCAEYGVIVGRVTANNGFGIPNAKISVFIPIQNEDLNNPLITSVYPYTVPTDKNDDGYRYNLLPYEKSYTKHAATGTFPTRLDALTDSTVIELVDKYYKFTVKTNDSGDYMIMGVPTGFQTLVMDVDLSDIGEFSLTPQDLIRMGLATESQVAGNQFKTSEDLESLPQIINITKTIEISPLWGEPEICQIAINRVDFDLRDDANVDIQPTAVFMGSMFSTSEKYRIRKNCKPRDNMGNLCGLVSGPGQILSVRQTVTQNADGNPILEEYRLEQSGNVIDDDGTWLVELPMNLDYIITNEFGDRVISPDPTLGIPTKGKYRFKVKWQQPNELTLQTRRAYYLVPNVREYGWSNTSIDPYVAGNTTQRKQLKSSYYFGLDWSGYTEGLTLSDSNEKINEIVNCEDTFYEFGYNRVYTVSSLIDQFKKGGRGRFIGIKEIDDDSCDGNINKFPVNDGFRNFDFLFFIFSLLLQVLQVVLIPIIIVAHFVVFLYTLLISALCAICAVKIPIINVRPFGFICNIFNIKCEKKNFTVRLPMITYPDCQACTCKDTNVDSSAVLGGASGVLSYVSLADSYYNNLQSYFATNTPSEDVSVKSIIYSQSLGGNNDNVADLNVFKTPKSIVQRFYSDESDERRFFTYSSSLTLGERINVFNNRDSYFSNLNKIKVSFANDNNSGISHYDNTITVLSNSFFESGSLLTTVDPATSTDSNFKFIETTTSGQQQGISGTTVQNGTSITVRYANSQTSNSSVVYSLPTGSTISRQVFPMDREYFQVVTAITISDAIKLWNTGSTQSFPNLLAKESQIILKKHRAFPLTGYRTDDVANFVPFEYFDNIGSQYILILQRGVDPYSPKYVNKYNLGVLFGTNENDSNFTITASTRINIPIQKLDITNKSVQNLTQNEVFYNSYFFTPGSAFSAFTSTTVGYYGALDSSYSTNTMQNQSMNGVIGKRTSTSNDFYQISESSSKYDLSEDLSGGSYIYLDINAGISFAYNDVSYRYITPSMYPTLLQSPMSFAVANKDKNVMRTDRLPSSDQLNGSSWSTNPSLLQQNNNFIFYTIPEIDGVANASSYSTGAEQVQPDLEDQAYSNKVLSSFDCENMVALSCYSGYSGEFGIKYNCSETDLVERGCYIFLTKPLVGLVDDLKNISEWGYRFRFFYGLCRGVLSQSFVNNWINGTLFSFPIQVNTYYDRQNKPLPPIFCKNVVYFESQSNNFYYRSSPYNNQTNKFIGKIKVDDTSVNQTNLLYPTTIINLGFKDSFYSEVSFDPSSNGYMMDKINPTSYSDTSDLVNLFVISRIIDEGFLQRLFQFGDNSLNQLFSRYERRIDGDLAQLMSINSEEGNISFSPEFYEFVTGSTSPVGLFGTPKNPTIGVFFSSTTENLQLKDFISPGRINFRATPTSTTTPFTYGIKSQVVPFYRWQLSNTIQIFGTEQNTWATAGNDIIQSNYQSLDRMSNTYFQGAGVVNDLNMRGYIFNVSGDSVLNFSSEYKSTGPVLNNKFLVGAPFHFYFGINQGATALNKFKTKYALDE